MAEAHSRKVFHAGEIIVTEGDIASGAYLIQSGKAEVYSIVEGKKVHIAYVGKEEVIGELAIIDKGLRTATVEAKETTVCIFIDKFLFERKMNEADPFLRAILRILVKRQRNILMLLGGHES